MSFISRSEWGAEKPQPEGGSVVHPNNRSHFVVHHSDGDNLGHPDPKQWVKNIYNYHKYTQGWGDIGYNFLVDWDGNVFEGRGWERSGACQYGLNTNGWCVCVLGNSDLPGNVTQATLKAVRALAEEADYRAGKSLVRWGHKDVADNGTACPGVVLYDWVHAGMPLAAEPPILTEKGRMFLVVQDSGKVLGADAEATTNGTPINQWALHGRVSQVWGVTPVGDGNVIRNLGADKVLSADLQPGRRVILWERQADNASQEWVFVPRNGAYVIVQVSSGLEVSLHGTDGAVPAMLVEAGSGDLFIGVWLDG